MTAVVCGAEDGIIAVHLLGRISTNIRILVQILCRCSDALALDEQV